MIVGRNKVPNVGAAIGRVALMPNALDARYASRVFT